MAKRDMNRPSRWQIIGTNGNPTRDTASQQLQVGYSGMESSPCWGVTKGAPAGDRWDARAQPLWQTARRRLRNETRAAVRPSNPRQALTTGLKPESRRKPCAPKPPAAPVTAAKTREQLNQDAHRDTEGKRGQTHNQDAHRDTEGKRGQTYNGVRASKQKGNWPFVKTQALSEISQTYQQTLLHNNAP